MSLASLIRSMAAAGAPPEAIALAVEAIENAEGKLASQREIARDRKRKQRAVSRDSHGTVTGQVEDSPAQPSPPPFFPPEPPQLPTPTPGITTRERLPSVALVADFERWWGVYPRKVGKGAARKAYFVARKKISEHGLLAALAARDWPDDEKFIPHPATWLNGERWEDGSGSGTLPLSPPGAPSIDPWPKRLREFQANGYWNTTDWGPKPGKPGCLAPVDGSLFDGVAA